MQAWLWWYLIRGQFSLQHRPIFSKCLFLSSHNCHPSVIDCTSAWNRWITDNGIPLKSWPPLAASSIPFWQIPEPRQQQCNSSISATTAPAVCLLLLVLLFKAHVLLWDWDNSSSSGGISTLSLWRQLDREQVQAAPSLAPALLEPD